MTDAFSQLQFVEVTKRRGRWVGPFIVLLVVIGLLAAAFFVVDNVARGYAANRVEAKVRSSLELPSSTPVDVTFAGPSVLLQLVGGTFEQVDIAIGGLSVGDLSGDATLTARGIPVDQNKAIDSVRVEFSADQSQLQKLVGDIQGMPVSSLAVKSGAIQVATTVNMLGVQLPVGIAFAPTAVDGQLVLTPKSVELNGKSLTPAELTSSLGPVGSALGAPRNICVASRLPKDFTLDSVAVSGDDLTLAVSAKSVVLGSQLLSTKGVCPAT